ncbi:hypothetical protein [Halobacillus yeomjeoni]|uniref:Uncharacterized protein n=1 Tax=Halobacillus yeomjeoni TaxID=311194 RepID=A0A931HXZ4_9BACI|nr:hypothetical protein [Halobacillus yeomjeoni]MBH0231475.1 hypothetical protein [Halobacillus yeomjeoni]
MDFYFYLNMLWNIIVTFFQHGVWVVGFFYLLNRMYENKAVGFVSQIVMIVSLVILFVHSFLISL